MKTNEACLFCKIVAKKIPAGVVFENEGVLAFKDIHPKAKTHYLFVTKAHYESLAHIPSNEMGVMTDIFSAIQGVAESEGFAPSGYKIQINTGAGGGQEVFHLHVHLLSSGP